MGLGLYQVDSPLPRAQAALQGAAATYGAMSQKKETTSTTTKEKKTDWGGMVMAGVLGAAMGVATGGTATFAMMGAASGMMNYMS